MMKCHRIALFVISSIWSPRSHCVRLPTRSLKWSPLFVDLKICRRANAPQTVVYNHPLLDNHVMQKMAVIRTIIRHYESVEDFAKVNPDLLQKASSALIEGRLFETVVSRAKQNYQSPDDQLMLEKLEKVEAHIWTYVKDWRLKGAKLKIERLLSSLLEGAGTFDERLREMQEAKALDEHLLRCISELIEEGKELFPERTGSQTVKLLKTIKQRIIAEIRTSMKGNDDLIRLLAFCFHVKEPGERQEILKNSVRSIERLTELVQFLKEGIQFGEKTGSITPNQINIMKELIEYAEFLNPLARSNDVIVESEDSVDGAEIDVDDIIDREMKRTGGIL